MYEDREWLELDECAERMGITPQEVLNLVRHRALRAVDYGMDLLYIEPAIVSGAIRTR